MSLQTVQVCFQNHLFSTGKSIKVQTKLKLLMGKVVFFCLGIIDKGYYVSDVTQPKMVIILHLSIIYNFLILHLILTGFAADCMV